MAGLYSVIAPEATTNLSANPSFESGVTGWTAGAGTLTRSDAYAVYGQHSGEYAPSAATTDGCYYSITLVAATAYAIQAKVRGALGVPYKLMLYDPAGGGTVIGTTTFTGTGDWQQVELLATTNGSTAFRVYVAKNASADVSHYYVDGLQVEAKTYCTTYVDGDQTGCTWSGIAHASISTRSSQSRAGGKIVEFEDYTGVYVERSTGIGMPPISNNLLDLAVLPGASWQSTKVKERQIILVISANGSSRANLHLLRQYLIDLFKPDAVAPANQPVILRYAGSGCTTQIKVRYDGGLELSTVDGFHESIMLRLLAEDPFFYEGFPRFQSLTSRQTTTQNRIVGKIDKVWSGLGNPSMEVAPVPQVFAIAQRPGTDEVYVGGSFADLDGIAAADNMAMYKISTGTWAAVGGGLSGMVMQLAWGPDDILYAAGGFTNAGGDANADYCAKYNPATGAWSTIGAGGPDDSCRAIAVHPLTGAVYVGGDFTSPGTRIAYYDTAWHALGAGAGNWVSSMAIDPSNGRIYAGVYTAGVYYSTGGNLTLLGLNNRADELLVLPGGQLLAVGPFTDTGMAYVAKWTGSRWEGIGTFSDYGYCVAIGPDGLIYIGGNFATVNGSALSDKVVVYNGTTFHQVDINLPGVTFVSALAFVNGELWMGHYSSGDAETSYPNHVVTVGSASSYPVIRITRTGGTSAKLESVFNATTGKKLLFNTNLLVGEVITINLTPGSKSVTSSVRGNILAEVNPASDLATWSLVPGDNQVDILASIVGAPTISLTMSWTNTYWSADSD